MIGWFEDFMAWLLELLLWLPRKAYELLLEGLLQILNVIPVPDWLTDLSTNFAGLPAGVAFFLQALQLPTGLAIVGSAYLVRFLIRRLPFFG